VVIAVTAMTKTTGHLPGAKKRFGTRRTNRAHQRSAQREHLRQLGIDATVNATQMMLAYSSRRFRGQPGALLRCATPTSRSSRRSGSPLERHGRALRDVELPPESKIAGDPQWIAFFPNAPRS